MVIVIDLYILNACTEMNIMRRFFTLFSSSHGAPTGIGDPPGMGMGTGEIFAPLELTGTGQGWGHPPAPSRPVDRLKSAKFYI